MIYVKYKYMENMMIDIENHQFYQFNKWKTQICTFCITVWLYQPAQGFLEWKQLFCYKKAAPHPAQCLYNRSLYPAVLPLVQR